MDYQEASTNRGDGSEAQEQEASAVYTGEELIEKFSQEVSLICYLPFNFWLANQSFVILVPSFGPCRKPDLQSAVSELSD